MTKGLATLCSYDGEWAIVCRDIDRRLEILNCFQLDLDDEICWTRILPGLVQRPFQSDEGTAVLSPRPGPEVAAQLYPDQEKPVPRSADIPPVNYRHASNPLQEVGRQSVGLSIACDPCLRLRFRVTYNAACSGALLASVPVERPKLHLDLRLK
jgi:hypothetical protein